MSSSLGYADRLKPKRNLGGQLGATEYNESLDDCKSKVETLAQMVKDRGKVFIFTGAGISTAAGIPDFRGPKGIWTLKRLKQKPQEDGMVPFEFVRPSFTHMAISALVSSGLATYVCSQNVDSLHLRSGVPRSKLAELHGNCFAERCTQCKTEYVRDFQIETVGFGITPRSCAVCGSPLADNILDWDSALPEDELEASEEHAKAAGVSLVLGTSLQITPANGIPQMCRRRGGRMVIVNLQRTPKDKYAELIIRARVDLVMALLMRSLGLQVPPYTRLERFVVSHTLASSMPLRVGVAAQPHGTSITTTSTEHSGASPQAWGFILTLASVHGESCPLPMVQSVALSCAVSPPANTQPPLKSDPDGSDRTEPRTSHGTSATPSGSAGCGQHGPLLCVVSPQGAVTQERVYRFAVSGVPHEVGEVCCTLQIQLKEYADDDRRDVVLQYSVRRPAEPSAPHTSQLKEDQHQYAAPRAQGQCGQPAGAECSSEAGQCSRTYEVISQQTAYSADDIIRQFELNPPEVVLPKVINRKKRKAGSSDAAAAGSDSSLSDNDTGSERGNNTRGGAAENSRRALKERAAQPVRRSQRNAVVTT